MDQLSLGSCTANGLASLVYFDILNHHSAHIIPANQPSRLFIYYNEREIEGTINQDAGAEIRDGIKSIANQGVCSELEWGYDINNFTVKPPVNAYTDALQFKAVTYARVDGTDKTAIVTALLNNYPVVFGFRVFESFITNAVAATGTVPMPKAGES